MGRLATILSRQTALMIVVAIFLGLTAISGDTFLSVGNLENVARQISIDLPVVLAQTIVLIAGGIDLSVGTTMAMAAILAIGLQPYGMGTAILGALSFGLAVGLINGLLVTRAGIVPFIVTLGTMSVTRGLMLTYTHQQPLTGTIDAFTVIGGGMIGPVPVPLVVTLGLALVLAGVLLYTRTGRNLYAVGGDREAAHLAGISTERYIIAAFVVSGLLSALGGVLLASRLNSASVQLGNDTPVLALSAALIGGASLFGGRGTVVGAILGATALGILANGMNLVGLATYQQIAIRAAILVTVVALDALAGRLAKRRRAGASVPKT
jgi:ribose transport system permease protein